jgi:hypothetical protein
MLQTPNPSIERTNYGLRPPLAAHVKRWALSSTLTMQLLKGDIQ